MSRSLARRTFVVGSLAAIGVTTATSDPAHAGTIQPQSAGQVPPDLMEVLRQVGNEEDLLLLASQSRLDGAVGWEASSIVVYADLPGDPMPDRLPHGAEVIRYTGLRASRLVRTGDAAVTRLSRLLYVPVDPRTGERLTTWRNPVDGKSRPAPPTYMREAKRVYSVEAQRLLIGTPDASGAPGTVVPSLRNSLSFSFPLRQAHSLAEKFGIGDPFGFGGTYTRMVTDQISVPDLDVRGLPTSVPAVASSATVQPFPPETALAEVTVHGRGLYVETTQTIRGLDQAARWLRQLVLTDYPDLLEPPCTASGEWDDNRWVAFHRDQLEPRDWTWQQWCEATAC